MIPDETAKVWKREFWTARTREVLWREAALVPSALVAAVAAGEDVSGARWQRVAADAGRDLAVAQKYEADHPHSRELCHTEMVCDWCGRPNPVWSIDNEGWAAAGLVHGGHPSGERSYVLCPSCWACAWAERHPGALLNLEVTP